MRTLVLTMLLTGCATAVPQMRGPQVASVGRESRICVDGAAPTQRAEVHRQVCAYVPPKNLVRQCHDELVADVEVVRATDAHCAAVLTPGDTSIEPGDRLSAASR